MGTRLPDSDKISCNKTKLILSDFFSFNIYITNQLKFVNEPKFF